MLNPATRATIDRPAAEELSKQWWVLLLSGLLAVVVGVVILSIQWTVHDLALVVAIFLIVNGALRMLTPPMDNTGRGWTLGVGLVTALVGVAFLAWPSVSLLTLAIFIGAWVLVRGVWDLAGGVSSRQDVKFWWLYVIVGVVEVGLGLVLLDRPDLSLALAIAIVGVWAILIGTLEILVAFEVKHLPDTLDRLAGG
ncbi:MAG TPA: DUF308 domain-containing protein [Acidimicrobiia bacterium]|nr:DUF308 domain-containing protein [Acidimicrobiia bacterium]